MTRLVTVRAPATTSNLGPGFDCLGMALDIWNTVRVEAGPAEVIICGEGSGELEAGPSNLVARCFRLPFQEAGREPPPVRITCDNAIPIGRGLGSSGAATVAGLVAGNEMCGRALDSRRLLELAVGIEGHPDNAAAALYGGFRVVVRTDSGLVSAPVPVPPKLNAVVFVPEVPMPTEEARAVLPRRIDMGDAVYNIGRAALLVRAFATGDLTDLAVATEDRLHQPARQPLFPAMKNIFRAALGAGALGVFLSGAGSSVLALTNGREMTIGYEMADAAAKSGVGGSLKITRPSPKGAHVVELE